MDTGLRTICGLLQHADPLRRTAAAIVLAELAPKDAAVVKALGEALPGAHQTLTNAILDAFDKIGSRAALPYMLPLLDVEDVAVQVRASGVITRAGAAALPFILPLITGANPARKLVLVDMLARIPTREAMHALLGLLPNADVNLTNEIAEAVHRHTRPATPAQRGVAHTLVASYMQTSAVKVSERMQGACLRLIGALNLPPARAILLKGAAPGTPPRIRLQALRGLQALEWTGATAKPIAAKLLPALQDADLDVAQQVMRLLSALPVDALSLTQWRALVDGPYAPMRSVALSRLTADTTTAGSKMLLDLLHHRETHVQDAAANALAVQANTMGVVLDALLAEADADRAWRLARILKAHAEALPAGAKTRLRDHATGTLKAGKPAADALLYLLRQADPAAAAALGRELAFAAMKARRWAEAVEGFRRLIHNPDFDDECRYALSVCNLKQSPKELAPNLRADDFALRGFQALLRTPGYDLLTRLARDKTLDAEDLYYVGFHFCSQLGDDLRFGQDLLRHVLKTWPRTPAGKAAKSKLGPELRPAAAKPASLKVEKSKRQNAAPKKQSRKR